MINVVILIWYLPFIKIFLQISYLFYNIQVIVQCSAITNCQCYIMLCYHHNYAMLNAWLEGNKLKSTHLYNGQFLANIKMSFQLGIHEE